MIDPDIVTPASSGFSGIWTDRRRALARVLEQQDEDCADLYRRAVDMFGESPLSGSALMSGSHCIRELSNRLPGVLGIVPQHSGVELTDAVEPLVQEWDRLRGSLTRHEAAAADLSALIAHADAIVHAHNVIDKSVQKNRSALALGDPRDIKNPTAIALRNEVRYFNGTATPRAAPPAGQRRSVRYSPTWKPSRPSSKDASGTSST